jgi:hypothetical protein
MSETKEYFKVCESICLDENYSEVRQKALTFLKKYNKPKKFIKNHELIVSKLINHDITDYGENNILHLEFALNFYLLSNITHNTSRLWDYKVHRENTNRTISKRIQKFTLNQNIIHTFLSKKLETFTFLFSSLDSSFELKRELEKIPLLKKSNTQNLLIEGKKPNISERYKIANDVFGVYETLNSKNISATDKNILLAHILGCNQQTARELFNGTQLKRTPVRENLINAYLKRLK